MSGSEHHKKFNDAFKRLDEVDAKIDKKFTLGPFEIKHDNSKGDLLKEHKLADKAAENANKGFDWDLKRGRASEQEIDLFAKTDDLYRDKSLKVEHKIISRDNTFAEKLGEALNPVSGLLKGAEGITKLFGDSKKGK